MEAEVEGAAAWWKPATSSPWFPFHRCAPGNAQPLHVYAVFNQFQLLSVRTQHRCFLRCFLAKQLHFVKAAIHSLSTISTSSNTIFSSASLTTITSGPLPITTTTSLKQSKPPTCPPRSYMYQRNLPPQHHKPPPPSCPSIWISLLVLPMAQGQAPLPTTFPRPISITSRTTITWRPPPSPTGFRRCQPVSVIKPPRPILSPGPPS